jgi:nucleoside-diphosphate-sugar epimerase
MAIFLTGGTGYIGSRVLSLLIGSGRPVTALARNEATARALVAQGASAVVGDITDPDFLAVQLKDSDGVIHLASAPDASAADIDHAVATAAVEALAGTGRPYVHTSGLWIWGPGDDLTEDDPLNPPAMVAWRPAIDEIVRSGAGMRGMIVAPATVHGHGGGGIIQLLAGLPRAANGALRYPGDGRQHVSGVHVDDVARLYVTVLDQGVHGQRYIATDGTGPTMRQVIEALSRGAGVAVPPEPLDADELAAMFGPALTEVLLLSQTSAADRARALGWRPTQPSLIEEFEAGHYTP